MQTPSETKSIITATKLAGGYDAPLWKNADFSIKAGEFIAVLGPNGAGKTTLFRMLLGLARPLKGSLSVLGTEPHKGNPRIGYVPQRHIVDSDTALEALEIVRLGINGNKWGFGAANHGRDEALEAIRLVGAEDLAHRPLGKLSGGELQRIFLAQALVSKPDILLLDEPLANLDIRRESNLVNLISKIVRSQNVTVLLIAHNINPLLPVLDRVLYVANGQVTLGTPAEVLNSESLSRLYDIPIEVLRDSRGRLAIIGIDEPTHHHE